MEKKTILTMAVHACMLSRFSLVRLFATLWTVLLCSSVHGILQVRMLEWGAFSKVPL